VPQKFQFMSWGLFCLQPECKYLCYVVLKHEAIQSFPSEHFYGGHLTVGLTQQSMSSTLPFWPRSSDEPIMFIHVIGAEKSLTVTTAEGSEQSKSNLKEASLAVSCLHQTTRVELTFYIHFECVRPVRLFNF